MVQACNPVLGKSLRQDTMTFQTAWSALGIPWQLGIHGRKTISQKEKGNGSALAFPTFTSNEKTLVNIAVGKHLINFTAF